MGSSAGVLGGGGGGIGGPAVLERLRDRGLVASGTEIAMLGSTSVQVHADGDRWSQKTVRKVSAARAEG